MMSSQPGSAKDLRLHGEHINLNSRSADEARKQPVNKSRPKSALYASSKANAPEFGRRPYSAGTDPQSPTLHSFLRRSQVEKIDNQNIRNNDYSKDPPLIPGGIESSKLFDKLLRDPIDATSRFLRAQTEFNFKAKHSFGCDNLSEISSVDTCTSLGTKIKEKAQVFEKIPISEKTCAVEGNSLKLKKLRTQTLSSFEKFLRDGEVDKILAEEKMAQETNRRLSIFVPHSKDDNTSSGVSSSSEVHHTHIQSPTKQADDYEKSKATPHRLMRSKKSPQISINWFPESFTNGSQSDCKEKEEALKHDRSIEEASDSRERTDNLVGRVSFANSTFKVQSSYEEEDGYDSYQNYATQLSLVEEESSQDSDMSPKHFSLPLNGAKQSDIYSYAAKEQTHQSTHEEPNNVLSQKYMEYSSNSRISADKDKTVDKKNEQVSTVGKRKQYTAAENDDMEYRFKELEEKYKNSLLTENVKPRSFSYKPEAPSKSTYSWTSLENIVSKEFEIDSSIMGKEIQVDGTTDKHSNSSYKNDAENSMEIDKQSLVTEFDCNKENDISKTKGDQSRKNKTNQAPAIIIDSNEAASQSKSDSSNISENQSSKTLDKLNRNKKGPESNDHKNHQDEILNKSETSQICTEKTKVYISIDYPQYLEQNESKSYTSKVIEDYKKEIASINNLHDLTIKDLRNKSYTFTETSDKTKPQKLEERFSRYGPGEYKSERTKGEHSTIETSLSPERVLKYYKKENLHFDFVTSENKDTKVSDDSSFDQFSKDFFDGTDRAKSPPKVCRPKLKRKTKKKDKSPDAKIKSNSHIDSSDGNANEKSKTETKRFLKSAPATNKTNNNCVKFKAQKITLSKSTTNVNKTLYTDSDRDIVSWMAARVETPCEETSSCDIPDTQPPSHLQHRSFNKNKSNEESAKREISLHLTPEQIETDIEPVIHIKPNLLSEMAPVHTAELKTSSLYKGKKDSLLCNGEKAHLKPKEAILDMGKYKSSLDEDTSLNDWEYNEPNNEIQNLLDDDSMVTDIYSVLKEIEQQKGKFGAGDAVTSKEQEVEENVTAEYKDIVSFLERVENSAMHDMSSLSYTQPPFATKVEELMDLSRAELAHRAVAGALAAGRAGAAVARLRAALSSAAQRTDARVQAARKAAQQKATAAATHTTQAILRHQKFIEQLINEKKVLTEKIEQLIAANAGAEARRTRAERAAGERLQLELRNQRQRMSVVHQREKQTWLKQHTQKIKEMTIKGLEGELQEIQEKNATREASLQREHEAEMIMERDQHALELRTLKDSAARQLEDKLDRERLLAAERLEQKRVEWEAAMAAAAERAGLESRDAAKRSEEAAKASRVEVESWKLLQEQDLLQRREQLDRQADERRAAMDEDASQLKKRLQSEFGEYKEEYTKKQAHSLKERELEIKATMRRERDREIEKAIDCMEMEAHEGRQEMQESIRRIKEKYESDLHSLEESERSALARCKDVREQLREAQEQSSMYQITITQLEGKVKQAEELKIQTTAQTDIALRAVEARGRDTIEELKAQQQTLQQQHKDEMHQLYAKVKVAVSRKDDSLTAARRDAATLRDRCLRLEARLSS